MTAKRLIASGHTSLWQWLGAMQRSLDRDRVLVLVVFLVGLLSRLPFRSHFLFSVDSVNYALALEEFDLTAHQPHPPGYLLYVVMGKLSTLLMGDAPEGLVLLSLLTGALALVAVFQLGTMMFDTATGLAAALLLGASPLFWFFSEVALPHVPDAFLATATMLLLYRAWKEDERLLLFAALALAVAGGLRPQTLAFLLPVYLLVGLSVARRTLLISTLALAVASLAWLAPLLALSGGPAEYARVMVDFMSRYHKPTSLFFGGAGAITRNLNLYLRYLAYGLNFGIFPIAVYGWLHRRDLLHHAATRQFKFLAAWVVPVTLVYLFIHMGQPGTIMVLLPGASLIAARCLTGLFTPHSVLSARPLLLLPALAILVASGAAQFLLLPDSILGRRPVALLTRSTISECDAHYARLLEQITDRFATSSSILVARDWRHLAYYLPSYQVMRARLSSDSDLKPVRIDATASQQGRLIDLVFVDVTPADQEPGAMETVAHLAGGILHTRVPDESLPFDVPVRPLRSQRSWSCAS